MHTHIKHCKFVISKRKEAHMGLIDQRNFSSAGVFCCIVKSFYRHSCSQDGKVLAK